VCVRERERECVCVHLITNGICSANRKQIENKYVNRKQYRHTVELLL